MNIIIVSGGNVGYYLAKTLLEHKHSVKLVENRKDLCKKIGKCIRH